MLIIYKRYSEHVNQQQIILVNDDMKLEDVGESVERYVHMCEV